MPPVVASIPCHMTLSGKQGCLSWWPRRDGACSRGWYIRSSCQYVTYGIEAHDPVSGLIVDLPVELHGVEIGNVARIELTDARTVGIWLHIAKDAPISRPRWQRSRRAASRHAVQPDASMSPWKIPAPRLVR